MSLIYLASPYSSDDPRVIEERMRIFLEVDAYLTHRGILTVSPMYKHFLASAGLGIPNTLEYWKNYCEALLMKCSGMIIIPSIGWATSPGVIMEKGLASQFKTPWSIFDLNLLDK